MKIRTITAGIDMDPSDLDTQMESASLFLNSAKEAFSDAGIEVQTKRLSTQSWEEYDIGSNMGNYLDLIKELESSARRNHIDFISIGPARKTESIGMIPMILDETTFVCTSAFLGDHSTGPIKQNIKTASDIILEISEISPDGSRNFMFAATSCMPPDVPFFPAAFHGKGGPSFTIGLESGDMVNRAALRTGSFEEFEDLLGYLYDRELVRVESVAKDLGGEYGYRGMDPSFAPGLSEDGSIALAIERVTGVPFGSHGTLSAASSITRSLSNITVKRCGYSGLMLPILEDEGLVTSAEIGSLDLQKLLLYSSVCGTGLDAVPVPGNTNPERIASVLSDVAYLSIKWNKPLSARLLPIPGRSAGEMTDLNSPYMRDCSILTLI